MRNYIYKEILQQEDSSILKSKVSQNTTNLLSNYKYDDMFRLTE